MNQPLIQVAVVEVTSQPPLSRILRTAFEDAFAGRGPMDERVYAVDGICGRKHRLFLNNLVRAVERPRYLEIGLFRGATFCAAISGNQVFATGVDNWSEFGGKANEFYLNLAAIKGSGAAVTIIEQDFRTVNYAAFERFNIGFYDGSHEELDQYDGARILINAMEPQAVMMSDDWNWPHVRHATMSAIRDMGRQIDLAIEVRTAVGEAEGGLPQIRGGASDWHNGMFAAVVST
jgi:hypothetical protein